MQRYVLIAEERGVEHAVILHVSIHDTITDAKSLQKSLSPIKEETDWQEKEPNIYCGSRLILQEGGPASNSIHPQVVWTIWDGTNQRGALDDSYADMIAPCDILKDTSSDAMFLARSHFDRVTEDEDKCASKDMSHFSCFCVY